MSRPGLIPLPRETVWGSGTLTLTEGSSILAHPSFDNAVHWFTGAFGASTGAALRKASDDEADETDITLIRDSSLPPEAYRLLVDSDSIVISAAGDPGAFYALQTLRQLAGPSAFRTAPIAGAGWTVPAVNIEDAPDLRWRGCLLDVARHFLPKREVLRFVDLLAAHKLNVLHLHLTDDQGWRFEVRKYPRLTEVGGWRARSQVGYAQPKAFDERPHGGFYTQDDLREIVAYAGERHVTVLPEIDLPGHMQAAIAAYPELGNTGERLEVWTEWGIDENVLNVEDATLAFFRDVLDELIDVFPSPVVSLGGDEVPTRQWRESPAAQAKSGALGLPDDGALQSWFIGELAAHLRRHGRELVVWDELVDSGLPAGAIVQSWRGVEGGLKAIAAGHDVVMCPEQWVYLDHRQSDRDDEPIPVGYPRTVDDVYAFEPVPSSVPEAGRPHVLGAQAQVWTEHLDSGRRVDYAAFPRLCAFAEVVWTSAHARNRDDFAVRLAGDHLARLDALGVEYRPLDGPRPWQTRPGVVGRSRG
jgi:hexosaminidase